MVMIHFFDWYTGDFAYDAYYVMSEEDWKKWKAAKEEVFDLLGGCHYTFGEGYQLYWRDFSDFYNCLEIQTIPAAAVPFCKKMFRDSGGLFPLHFDEEENI